MSVSSDQAVHAQSPSFYRKGKGTSARQGVVRVELRFPSSRNHTTQTNQDRIKTFVRQSTRYSSRQNAAIKITSSSAIAERPRCTVGYGQKWKTGTGRQYFTDIIGQPLWRNWSAKQSNSVKKQHKIRAITPLKVIEVGINRKPVCDFLLVINTNWHHISYRFGVIADRQTDFLIGSSRWHSIQRGKKSWFLGPLFYHPRMRHDKVFSRICLCVCLQCCNC